MPKFSRLILLAVITALGLMVLPARADCERQLVVRADTSVYDNKPTFSSGRGWMSGKVIGVVARGAQVATFRSKVPKVYWYSCASRSRTDFSGRL